MSIKLKIADEVRERVERDWTAWWNGELNRPMVWIESMNVLFLRRSEEFSREFLLERPVDELIDCYQKRLEKITYHGDALPRWFPNYGPGIVAGFLGSKVEGDASTHTIWFEADKPAELENLNFEFNPENQWWKRVRDLTKAAVERWGDSISVGHTDLGGNLDILASFRTSQQLLYDLIDAPEVVEKLAAQITKAWLRYYDELHDIIKVSRRGTSGWADIWSPGRTYMLQSDFCYMISPKMFERFVMPDLEACLETMDHGFYHLDGKEQISHLDMLLSLEKLAGIQWVPGDGAPQPEEWLPLLKRIRDGGKRVQVYVSPEAALKIVREIGGKGFALYVINWPPMSESKVKDYLKELSEVDITR